MVTPARKHQAKTLVVAGGAATTASMPWLSSSSGVEKTGAAPAAPGGRPWDRRRRRVPPRPPATTWLRPIMPRPMTPIAGPRSSFDPLDDRLDIFLVTTGGPAKRAPAAAFAVSKVEVTVETWKEVIGNWVVHPASDAVRARRVARSSHPAIGRIYEHMVYFAAIGGAVTEVIPPTAESGLICCSVQPASLANWTRPIAALMSVIRALKDQLVLVTSLHALIAQEASLSFEFWVSGDDHAALPSRHVLGRVEAEGSERSETPDLGAADRRRSEPGSVRTPTAVLLSNRHDLGHVVGWP